MYRKLSLKWGSFSDDSRPNPIEIAFKSDDIIKQGYLSKQSAHLKAVRKRWMVLKRDYLYSYKQTKQPTEIFDLSIYDTVQKSTDYGPSKFELLSTSKKISRIFNANSVKDRNEWVDAIKQIQSDIHYKNWNYNKSLKTKSNKLQKLGYKKSHINTAFMNHSPTDDPIDPIESCDTPSNQQHIIDQLYKFGYSKSESMEAMNNVQNKNDINSITDYLHNKVYNTDIMDDATETQCFAKKTAVHTSKRMANSSQWELLIDPMTSKIPSEQQLLIFLKLKILAERITQNVPKYRSLSLNDTKLQKTVLTLNGGLMLLYELGFEHDAVSKETLICNKFDPDVVKACIECLKNKMNVLSKNVDFDKYRSGTISDNIIAISTETKEIIHNPTDDPIDSDTSDIMDNLYGGTKQFYKFLDEHNLVKYFDAFRKKECCNITDIEYLMDDDEQFLENDIGITNSFHRKKLVGECKKLKTKMDDFQDSNLMPLIVKKRLSKNGAVTMDILMDEIENRSDLKSKFGVNNEDHCDLVWNIIALQSNTTDGQQTNTNQQYEEEGVQNVASNQTNYISR